MLEQLRKQARCLWYWTSCGERCLAILGGRASYAEVRLAIATSRWTSEEGSRLFICSSLKRRQRVLGSTTSKSELLVCIPTVKASNSGPHGSFEPFLESSVAFLEDIISMIDRIEHADLKCFCNLHSLHFSSGSHRAGGLVHDLSRSREAL